MKKFLKSLLKVVLYIIGIIVLLICLIALGDEIYRSIKKRKLETYINELNKKNKYDYENYFDFIKKNFKKKHDVKLPFFTPCIGEEIGDQTGRYILPLMDKNYINSPLNGYLGSILCNDKYVVYFDCTSLGNAPLYIYNINIKKIDTIHFSFAYDFFDSYLIGDNIIVNDVGIIRTYNIKTKTELSYKSNKPFNTAVDRLIANAGAEAYPLSDKYIYAIYFTVNKDGSKNHYWGYLDLNKNEIIPVSKERIQPITISNSKIFYVKRYLKNDIYELDKEVYYYDFEKKQIGRVKDFVYTENYETIDNNITYTTMNSKFYRIEDKNLLYDIKMYRNEDFRLQKQYRIKFKFNFEIEFLDIIDNGIYENYLFFSVNEKKKYWGRDIKRYYVYDLDKNKLYSMKIPNFVFSNQDNYGFNIKIFDNKKGQDFISAGEFGIY